MPRNPQKVETHLCFPFSRELQIDLTGVTSQLHGTDGGRFDVISGRMGGKFEMGPGKHRPWKRICGFVFA